MPQIFLEQHYFNLPRLEPGKPGRALVRVRGGPGNIYAESKAVSIEPNLFGPGETMLTILIYPPHFRRRATAKVDLVSHDGDEQSIQIDADWRSRVPRRSVFVSVMVGVAVILLLFLVIHGISGNGDSQSTQVDAVNSILREGGQAPIRLVSAIDQAKRCQQTDVAIQTITDITHTRDTQVSEAHRLNVDAIADGPAIKERLTAALSASLNADKHFLAWARRNAGENCSANWSQDVDYNLGITFSDEAGAAKSEFIRIWNPIARKNDLPERSDSEI